MCLLLAIFGVLVVLGTIMVLAIGRLITVLPSYATEADGLVNDLRNWLVSQGVDRETVTAALADVNVQAILQRLVPLVSGVAGLVMNAIFLLSLMLFLGIDATGALGRMAAVNRLRPRLGEAFRIFSANTRRFLGVTTVFALITGLADTLLLWWLDERSWWIGVSLAVASNLNLVVFYGWTGHTTRTIVAGLDVTVWAALLIVLMVTAVAARLLVRDVPQFDRRVVGGTQSN